MTDGIHELSKEPALVARRRSVFIQLLACNGGNVLKAALAVGYSNTQELRRHKDKDPEFSREWDAAIECSNDVLEAHAVDLATVGDEEHIYFQGEVVGTKRVRSVGMLTTLLKARKPKEYSDKKEVNTTVNHKVGIALVPTRCLTSEEWERKHAVDADYEEVPALPKPEKPVA